MRETSCLIFLLFFVVIGCVSSGEDRSFVERPVVERSVANFDGGERAACRDSSDCRAPFICRAQWCKLPSSLGEAFESCVTGRDCLSGYCRSGECLPSMNAPAANGRACLGGSGNCRSGNCGNDGICQPSDSHPNFPGQACRVDSDCVGRCDRSRQPSICASTEIGGRADRVSQCTEIAKSCTVSSDCCSGNCFESRCVGRLSRECLKGQCDGAAGRICASPGTTVSQPFECCSGKALRSVCVSDFSLPTQVCTRPEHCRSGFRCDVRTRICVAE